MATAQASQPALAGRPYVDVAPHRIERSLKRGALWAIGSQVGVQVVRLLAVVALARMLSPTEYGAAALAVTIAGFSTILGDLGFGTALVQARAVNQRLASTALWCALGAGMLGSAVVAMGAYPAALAFDEPEITGLVIAGGLTLLLVAAGSASNALLTRSMSFGIIQGAGLAAATLAAVSAVAAAALGAGAWALVLQQLVLAGATSALFVVAARWRPSLEFSRTAYRSMARFALPLTGGGLLFALQSVVTVLLVGRFLGIEALGIWNFAMAIVVLPAALLSVPVARVVYAAFARMRDRPERIAAVWLNGLVLLAGVVLPTLFGLIAVAPDLIPLTFGSQWTEAVPVIQILAVFLMSRALQTWNSAVMDAAGKPHIAAILNGLVLLALPLTVWLGSRFGVEGVAVAFSLASVLCGELPSFLLTTRELRLGRMTVLRRLRAILICAAVACVSAAAMRHALGALGAAQDVRVAGAILAGAAAYLACLAVGARDVALQLLSMVRGVGGSLRAG